MKNFKSEFGIERSTHRAGSSIVPVSGPGVAGSRASSSGVALIMTLTILAIVVLLVMGFAVSMRVEQISSRNFTRAVVSRQFADAAIARALFLIRTNTPAISATEWWVSQPGRIVVKDLSGVYYPTLFSNDAGDTNDLNYRAVITGSNVFYNIPANRRIQVNWIKVCTNGASSGAPLLGRYAFWVDDEASKIDINAAERRTGLLGPTTRHVDLTVLENSFGLGSATESFNYAQSTGYYTTEQWKDPLPSKYEQNRFYITAYGSDPGQTPWGERRLNINDAMTNATATAIQSMTNLLNNANLSNWFGETFQQKYSNTQQIAANIIDYADTNSTPTDSSGSWQDTNPPQYLGLEKTPYLNEIQLTNEIRIVEIAGQYEYKFDTQTNVELWNMYSTDFTPPAGSEILLTNRPIIEVRIGGATGAVVFAYNLSGSAIITTGPGLNAILSTNTAGYSSNNLTESFITTNGLADTIVVPATTAILIYRSPSGRMDYASVPLSAVTVPFVAPLPGGTNTTQASQRSAANDPRVKPVNNNWVALSSGAAGTIGAANIGVLDRTVVTTNGTDLVVGDGDDTSHLVISDGGPLVSIGELGYIHSGLPWRTLRLQPQPAQEIPLVGQRAIPDWAVLDLFSVTNQAVTGRVNLNAAVTNLSSSTLPHRTKSIDALLTAATSITAPNAEDIYSRNFTNVVSAAWLSGVYTFAGQVCEVVGMDNGSDDEKRERRIRSFANLITTRSSHFTVWAVGQAIQKVDATDSSNYRPDLGDYILGESRIQAVVERYDSATDGQGGVFGVQPDLPAYRVVYYRYLTE